MSTRTEALARRLEEGAQALAAFAAGLTDAQWQTQVPGDGRKVGVVVHHVASMYPIEIQLAQQLAEGSAVVGVTSDDVDAINAAHAARHDAVSRTEAIELLERNSAEAAAAIRQMTDAQLDNAAPLSLNNDVVLTCQFMLEDHAVRHSYHHLAILRRTAGAVDDLRGPASRAA
jgi:hypothetical protein